MGYIRSSCSSERNLSGPFHSYQEVTGGAVLVFTSLVIVYLQRRDPPEIDATIVSSAIVARPALMADDGGIWDDESGRQSFRKSARLV